MKFRRMIYGLLVPRDRRLNGSGIQKRTRQAPALMPGHGVFYEANKLFSDSRDAFALFQC